MKYLVLVFALIGCAIMSESECQNGDWSQYGRQDAMDGKQHSQFFERRKTCYEHGIKGDQESYKRGYTQGLKNYCTFENGFEIGSRGEKYSQICPSDLHEKLTRGHLIGTNRYEEKKRHEEFQKQVDSSIKQNQELRERIMGNNQKKSCIFKNDCVITDRCIVSKCSKTSRACNFDSDCNIQGQCSNRMCTY